MNIRLLYWKVERRGLLGSRYCRRRIRSSREKSELYQTMSWRGRPERWVTRSRTVICSVRVGSYSLNEGKTERTGRSQPPLPSSMSMPRSVTVKDFVMLAMAQSDFG